MKAIVIRIATLLRRNKRAHQFGFRFRRAAGFALPSEILLGSKKVSLDMPPDSGTRTAFVDVLLDDCYRLRQLPTDLHTVADIGAHVGLFSIAARNRWPQALIHAYEPNPALKPFWAHHAVQAGFEGHAEAVGLTAGTVSLVTGSESVQVRSQENPGGMIPQIAFREVLSRLGGSVDLVKLDCEGAEWQILQDVTSWQRVRFLTMEFHLWAGYTLPELKSRIGGLGFHIRHCEMAGKDFGLLLAAR